MVLYLTGIHFPLAFLIGCAIIAALALCAGAVLVVACGVMRLIGLAVDHFDRRRR